MTMDEKMGFVSEVNKLLSTISGYQLTISVKEVEYDDIFITDKGYIKRLYLEYGEICNVFLGETRKEAISSLAHKWVESYCCITSPEQLWSNEKDLSEFNKIKRFRAHCDYAQRSFVELRKLNDRDSCRQYDDFMKQSLHMAYPEQKFHPVRVV